jgi:hypothetical protein
MDIPFDDDLAEFEAMSDCAIYFYWDNAGKIPYTIQEGTAVPHSGLLSCVGTEGAIHQSYVYFTGYRE